MKTMVFFFKMMVSVVWFCLTCLFALFSSILTLRHPSNAYLFTYLFTRGVTWFLGVKIQIKNENVLRTAQPCVYIGNHQSNLDILTHAYCFQARTICVGKKEVIWIPFFGILFYLTGCILLDRKNHEKAVIGMRKAQEALTLRNLSIYMFPEGTRNKGSQQLLPFKKGAFYMAIDAQVPIVPVVSSQIDDLISLPNKTIKRGTVHIEVFDPIPTRGMTHDDLDRLMKICYDKMQNEFSKIKSVPFES